MFSKLLAPFVLIYIASVLLVNIGFSYVPLIPTPIGLLSPMAFIVGGVFVIRDFAQRQSGHYILVAMLIATGISFVMADPFVAVASAAAFLTSEIADYALYTFTNKPFHQRVLISSIVSTPIDTAVFLLGIQSFTVGTFALMILSKMVAAILIFVTYRDRVERVSNTTDGSRMTSNPYLSTDAGAPEGSWKA